MGFLNDALATVLATVEFFFLWLRARRYVLLCEMSMCKRACVYVWVVVVSEKQGLAEGSAQMSFETQSKLQCFWL